MHTCIFLFELELCPLLRFKYTFIHRYLQVACNAWDTVLGLEDSVTRKTALSLKGQQFNQWLSRESETQVYQMFICVEKQGISLGKVHCLVLSSPTRSICGLATLQPAVAQWVGSCDMKHGGTSSLRLQAPLSPGRVGRRAHKSVLSNTSGQVQKVRWGCWATRQRPQETQWPFMPVHVQGEQSIHWSSFITLIPLTSDFCCPLSSFMCFSSREVRINS